METKFQAKFDTSSKHFWTAAALIIIGFLFLLDNFGIVDVGDIWQYWPVILIVIGFLKLKNSNFQDRQSAFLLIGVGVAFLLFSTEILDRGELRNLWPLILIAIGVSMIFKHRDGNRRRNGGKISENRVDAAAIFGGMTKKIISKNFEGGNVTAVFGGVDLDFSDAELAEGESVIDVFTMFGGTEISVPKEWHVIMKGMPIFGGFEDSRRNVESDEKADKKLVIKGTVLFGGLEVKNA